MHCVITVGEMMGYEMIDIDIVEQTWNPHEEHENEDIDDNEEPVIEMGYDYVVEEREVEEYFSSGNEQLPEVVDLTGDYHDDIFDLTSQATIEEGYEADSDDDLECDEDMETQ